MQEYLDLSGDLTITSIYNIVDLHIFNNFMKEIFTFCSLKFKN